MTRRTVLRAVLPALAALRVLGGVLPGPDLVELWTRIWQILLFVTAMTVVTDLLFSAGVFERVISASARLARGRVLTLWLVTVLLAVTCTVFFSLDTTAVLLTPLVVLLARRAGLPPLPFAVTIVWLANTASLLLPVSNLTNLLVQERLEYSPAAFAGLVYGPAAIGAAGANAVNNLPAYLALEPAAGSPLRLAALLIGVNPALLVTPWGPLATLLWAERLRSLGITIRWCRSPGPGCWSPR